MSFDNFFNAAQTEAAAARDPLHGASEKDPARATFQLQSIILQVPAEQVDAAMEITGWPLWTKEGGDTAAPCQIKGPGVDKDSGEPFESHVYVKFSGGLTFPDAADGYSFEPIAMEKDARRKPSLMWPIAPKATMRARSWAGWVSGADQRCAPLFAQMRHELRPHKGLARMMPVASQGDSEPVEGLAGALEVIRQMGDLLAAEALDSGSIPIEIGCYSKIGADGFPQIELCALPWTLPSKGGGKRR